MDKLPITAEITLYSKKQNAVKYRVIAEYVTPEQLNRFMYSKHPITLSLEGCAEMDFSNGLTRYLIKQLGFGFLIPGWGTWETESAKLEYKKVID